MNKLTLNLLTLSCITVLTGCASDQHIVVHNSTPKPAKVSTAGNTVNIELSDDSNASKPVTNSSSGDSDDAWSWLNPKSNKKTDSDNESDSNTDTASSSDDNTNATQSSDELWAEIFGRRGDKSNDDSEDNVTEDDDWGEDESEETPPTTNKNKKANAESNSTNNKANKNTDKTDNTDDGEEASTPTNNDAATARKLIKAQKEISTLKAKLTELEEKLSDFEEQEGTQGDELAKAQKEIVALKAKLAKAESKQPKPTKDSEFFTTLKQSDAFALDGTGKMVGKMKTTNADNSDVFNGVVLTIDNLESESEGEVVLSIEQGAKNGRSATDSLTTFKLDDTIEITLTDLADNHIRNLKDSDFSKGAFSGLGFVGSNNTDNEHGQPSGVRYGVYTVDDKSILFVHGKPAESAFEGRYVGNAIYGKDGKYTMLKDAMTAVVSLNDRKNQTGKIDVAINVGGGEILNFGGNVLGNTFEGNRGDAETKGGFYGNGGDIGGVFHVTKEGDQQGYNGVFGGSK